MNPAQETSAGLCRTCGKEANNKCSGCKGAFYCSKDCQRWDWKEAMHKTLCRGPEVNRKIHIILRELFVAEYDWLKGLTFAEKEELLNDCALHDKLNHIFISGEVALVLARGVPCMYPSNFIVHTPMFSCRYTINVLNPWIRKHQKFLLEQGFAIETIDHGVYISDKPVSKPDSDEELLDIVVGESLGSLLIRDLRSPDNELVEKVFLTRRPAHLKEWTENDGNVIFKDVLQCLSFRTSDIPSYADDGDDMTDLAGVYYGFVFPNQIFGDENVCCSAAFKNRFFIHSNDATILGKHFRKCYDAMNAIGFPIHLEWKHVENWSDTAVIATIRAMAGDLATLHSWLTNARVPVKFNAGDIERGNRVAQALHQLRERDFCECLGSSLSLTW